MMRKQRGRVGSSAETSLVAKGPCAVCGASDARALLGVELASGELVSLCGSHDLMRRRAGSAAESLAALVTLFSDRRSTDRRGGKGDVDELAEALSAAFCRDRRSSARRAS